MANRTKLTPSKKAEFVEKLKKTPNVSNVAKSMNLSRTVLYDHKNSDEAFSEEWDKAIPIGEANLLNDLEDICDERAREGSDILLMFRMKKLNPQYAKQVVAGDKDAPLVLELSSE